MTTNKIDHAARAFTGTHMLLIMISFFGVVVSVNLTLAYFARSSWSGLVVQNSYVASQNFDKDLRIAREQQAMGWREQLAISRDFVSITMQDSNGALLTGLSVQLILRRPATDANDHSLQLTETGKGVYSAKVEISTGVWDADVTAERIGKGAVRNVHRVVIK